MPQVLDAVNVPVLAAGAIADGRGVAAALALGAAGAVVGTRFIATHESQATPEYRNTILQARDDTTMRTRCYTGKPARSIRTPYAVESERDRSKIRPFPQQARRFRGLPRGSVNLAAASKLGKKRRMICKWFRGAN